MHEITILWFSIGSMIRTHDNQAENVCLTDFLDFLQIC